MALTKNDRFELEHLILRRTKTWRLPEDQRRFGLTLAATAVVALVLAALVWPWFFVVTMFAGVGFLRELRQTGEIGAAGEKSPLSPREIASLRKRMSAAAFAALTARAGMDAGGLLCLGHASLLLNEDAEERSAAQFDELRRRQQEVLE